MMTFMYCSLYMAGASYIEVSMSSGSSWGGATGMSLMTIRGPLSVFKTILPSGVQVT